MKIIAKDGASEVEDSRRFTSLRILVTMKRRKVGQNSSWGNTTLKTPYMEDIYLPPLQPLLSPTSYMFLALILVVKIISSNY